MTSFLSLLVGLLSVMGGPVTGLSIQPAPERTEVVISMQGQAEYRDFTMEGPSRLVVDLLDARHALPRDNFLDLKKDQEIVKVGNEVELTTEDIPDEQEIWVFSL